MANTQSRAYKLQLSAEGIELFLRCHDRLCRAVGDLLPYGATLFVAVSVMSDAASDEIAAVLLDPSVKRIGGRTIRYVGTSPRLSVVVEGIAQRVNALGMVHPSPTIWKLFLAALILMEEARSEVLVAGFNSIQNCKRQGDVDA